MPDKHLNDEKNLLAWEHDLVELCKQENYQILTRKVEIAQQWRITSGQDTVQINLYHNGTIHIQGKDGFLRRKISHFCFGDKMITSSKEKSSKELPDILLSSPKRIGLDEVGKGDYFGPLVVAGAYLDEDTEPIVKKLGIRDSKKLEDSKIIELAKKLQTMIPHYVFVLMPKEYNMIYDRERNLNHLLSICHAQTLENLLVTQPAQVAIVDQFNKNENVLTKKLLERGRTIQLIQVPNGERDMAVAMASIFARTAFLEKLHELRQTFQIHFPKGANHLGKALHDFIQKYGWARLNEVAKVHFNIAHAYHQPTTEQEKQ